MDNVVDDDEVMKIQNSGDEVSISGVTNVFENHMSTPTSTSTSTSISISKPIALTTNRSSNNSTSLYDLWRRRIKEIKAHAASRRRGLLRHELAKLCFLETQVEQWRMGTLTRDAIVEP
jgi:hypothetical protein